MAYREYPFINGRPLIPIKVQNPTTNVEVPAMGLIDSGADFCMFPGFIARDLGYDLKTGTAEEGIAAGQHKLYTWKHPVIIHLMHPEKKDIKLMSLPARPVAFVEADGFPLLGAGDFLFGFNSITLLYSMKLVRIADHKK